MPSGLPAPVTTTTRPDRSNAAGHCPILIGLVSRCVPHKTSDPARHAPLTAGKQQVSQLCIALLKPTADQLTGTTAGNPVLRVRPSRITLRAARSGWPDPAGGPGHPFQAWHELVIASEITGHG
jgi:hypothetical protein